MSLGIDYQLLFENAPGLYLVLDPDFKIVAVNHAYLAATKTKRNEIVGRGLFEVFPDNPDDQNADGVANLSASLGRAKKYLLPDPMAVQKYDVPLPPEEGGGFIEKYWSPLNVPILNAGGKLTHLLHRVEDVTEYIQLKRSGSEQQKLARELLEKVENAELEVVLHAKKIEKMNRELEAARDLIQAELRSSKNDLSTLVEELASKKREVEQALEEAEKLSHMKSNFLNLISHEIRTPLNLMQLQLYTLKDEIGKDLSPFHAQVVESLFQASRRLLNLMESLLSYARIQSGRLTLHLEEIDPIETISETVDELVPLAAEKNLSLTFKGDPSKPTKLSTDRDLLRLAVINLIVNAIKYTDQGEVEVSVKKIEGAHRISVRDTGRGIGIDQQAAIFEPFEQLEAVPRKHKSGVGLGLAISKGMVEVLGGKIELSSRPGEGSTFSIVLPTPSLATPGGFP